MSIVTLYALIGVSYQISILTKIYLQDDIRLWVTRRPTDPIFFSLMLGCLFLFSSEIIINSVVVDEFKYSFFFYLDIIATLSIVFDIPYLLYPLNKLLGSPTREDDNNAIAGVLHEASIAQGKINALIKSLRLIRLIRIIKLYKYFIQALRGKDPDENEEEEKKKEEEGLDEEET